jgi:hypothetical protein
MSFHHFNRLTNVSFIRGSATGSNQLDHLAITYPTGLSEQHMAEKSTSQQQHKKKRAIKNNLLQTRLVQPWQPASRSLVLLLVRPWELGARKDLIFDQFASVWHAFVVLEVCMTKLWMFFCTT